MTRPPILDKSQSYTFSKYFELKADPEDIFAELGLPLKSRHCNCRLHRKDLNFCQFLKKDFYKRLNWLI